MLTVLFNLVKAIGVTIWEPLKTGFQFIGDAIQNIFNNIINFFINRKNDIVWIINKIINNPVTRKLFGAGEDSEIKLLSNIKAPEKQERSVDTDAIVNAWKDVGTSFKGYIGTFIDTGKTALEKNFGDVGKQIQNAVKGIVKSNKGIIESNKEIVAIEGQKAQEEKENKSSSKEGKGKDIRDSLGDVGGIMKGLESGGIMGAISEVIGSILKPLMAIGNVAKVLNFVSTIFERMFSILEPLINQLLAPFVVILEIIGEILASILMPILTLAIELLHPLLDVLVIIFQCLSPIISAFGIIIELLVKLNPILLILSAAFNVVGNVIAFIYNNILRPIINFFGKIFVGVYNFIISIWNAIANFLNNISIFGWHPFKLKTHSAKTWTDLEEVSGENDYANMPGSKDNTTSGSSSSYSAAKDTIVNIYFNHSFVNGDAREIALAIEAELESAHGLGY
jgi:hypothetical protein